MFLRLRKWFGFLARPTPDPAAFEPPVALALERAIENLRGLEPRVAKVVELRLLDRLSLDQVAAQMQLPRAVAKREWVFGKAWLRREMRQSCV